MKRTALRVSGALLWVELIATYVGIYTMTSFLLLTTDTGLRHHVLQELMVVGYLDFGPLFVIQAQYGVESQVSVALGYLTGVVLVGLWWRR